MDKEDKRDIMLAIIVSGIEAKAYFTEAAAVVDRAVRLIEEIEKRKENK